MERIKIDLQQRFLDEICSFEIAKKAKEAGMTCANMFYAYDEQGNLGDGAWLEDEDKLIKKFPMMQGKFKAPILYPAIMFPFAVGMLGETDIGDWKKVDFYEFNKKYFLKYKDELYQSNNIVDVLVSLWIKHKTTRGGEGAVSGEQVISPMPNN